jgi:lactate dehydrogenase-like 2-hydroxyacid dehydrogenase
MSMQVIMPRPMSPFAISRIEAQLPLTKLWEAEDPEAMLAKVAPDVKAIAAAAHSVIGGDVMSRYPNLELVAYFGVGYETVDVAWAARHGIVVTNTPDVLNEEVADTTMALMLNTVRQLPAAERYLRAGKWIEKPFRLSASLQGRTIGIVGLGRIGKAIAKRCEAFGLTVVYHGRSPQPGVPLLYYPTLLGLAKACDVLVVMAPGGAGTRNLIDAEVLRALGPNGVLINMARGSLVDEDALIEALRSGTIAAAGLDVYRDEPRVPPALIDMDHVVLLPHVGSASEPTRDLMSQVVVDNLVSWAAGKGPLTPVAETPYPARRSA